MLQERLFETHDARRSLWTLIKPQTSTNIVDLLVPESRRRERSGTPGKTYMHVAASTEKRYSGLKGGMDT